MLAPMTRRLDRRQLFQLGAAAALPWAAASAADNPVKMPAKVRVGLIGIDGHFSEATKVARSYPQVEITAFEMTSPREQQRAAGVAELKGAKRYDDYRKMLADERLDAAVICDQNWRRAETVAACLEKGLPVAAEKPFGLSIAELDSLEALAAKTKTPLTMLLPMRYVPAYVAMKEIVSGGGIGEAALVSGQKSYRLGERPEWMKRRETFGGTIPYIACHVVDLLRFISGRDMVKTAAFHSHIGFPQTREMENTCAIAYGLDNGGTGDVRLDYLRPETAPTHGDDRVRIAGTKGVIEYQRGSLTLITADKAPAEVTDRPQTRTLFEDFLDAVYNDAAPMLTAAEAFRVSRIVVRSREAADAGRVLDI